LVFEQTMKSEPGPPMTLGAAAAAQVRLIVWCKACQHQVEPDPAEMAARYGAETPVLEIGTSGWSTPTATPQVDIVARVKCARVSCPANRPRARPPEEGRK